MLEDEDGNEGELSPKKRACLTSNMIELILKSVLVYHSPTCEAWQATKKRSVEVSCDVMPDLVAYETTVQTRTHSRGMCRHIRQLSRLPSMHNLVVAWLLNV